MVSFESYFYLGRSQTTFTRFVFFRPPTPLRLHFLWYKSLQKVNFLTTYPPSLVNVVCERPLRMLKIRYLNRYLFYKFGRKYDKKVEIQFFVTGVLKSFNAQPGIKYFLLQLR